MLLRLQRNAGFLVLGIWLLLVGINGLMPLGLPPILSAVLALIAGVLILAGR
jgi:hypothetical protein